MTRRKCLTCCLMTAGFSLACFTILVLTTAIHGDEAACAGPVQVAEGQNKRELGPSDNLRKLLTERHQVLKILEGTLRQQYRMGRIGKISDLLEATIEMLHAEADLCSTHAERLKVYEKLVNALSNHEQLVRMGVDKGIRPSIDVLRVRAAMLKAQIDLERLRLAQEASQ